MLILNDVEFEEVSRIYKRYGEDYCEPAYKLFCKAVKNHLPWFVVGVESPHGTMAATPGVKVPNPDGKECDLFIIGKYMNKFKGMLTGNGTYDATPCYYIGNTSREGIRVSEYGYASNGRVQMYHNYSRVIYKPIGLSNLFNRFKREYNSRDEYLIAFDEIVSKVVSALKKWIDTLGSKKAGLNHRSFLRNTKESVLSINRKAGFNGWANYPTWYLNLFLIEEEDPDTLEKFVKDVLEDSDKEYPEAVLAEALEDRAKEYIYDLDNIPSDGLGSTLIQYALSQVDFMEISKHLYRLAKDEGWLEEADED